MSSIVFIMHSDSRVGYAIEKLEKVFYGSAIDAGFLPDNIYFVYRSIDKGKPTWMKDEQNNYFEFNYKKYGQVKADGFQSFLKENNIDNAFVFDLQPSHRVNSLLRSSGVNNIISYWGAPISSYNAGIKLSLKRLEVLLRKSGPDYYIFESEAMRNLAIRGRGIPMGKTCVIPTGVDTQRFCPQKTRFAYEEYGIPEDRKIFCYSGHMEERKGVHVIIRAMDEIVNKIGRKDIHFLAMGNKKNEEDRFYSLAAPDTFNYVTFGGYRPEIEKIFSSCYAGIIASTGWDSWPMSVIEMASCGIPLLVSRLQGLLEFVEDQVNGYGFKTGDQSALAQRMIQLADDKSVANIMGANNRAKVLRYYSNIVQQKRLSEIIAKVCN